MDYRKFFNSAALPRMKGNAVSFFILIVTACLLSSCEKADFGELDEEEESKAEQASLTIKTRANSAEDGEVSYPVKVYVLDSDGKCVGFSQLDSKTDELKFSLEKGTYDVYAIAGASEDGYDLPSKDNVSPTSKIALRDNMEHDDLMTSSDNVVLAKGEKNTLTLAMTRRVAEIESINLEGLPSEVTAVEVTLSPLAKYLLLNGSYSEETTSKTISLTKNSDNGTWTNNSGIYILGSTTNISIKVAITASGSKSSYTSNYKGKVEANHKLTINGKFDNNYITLEGVLTGAKWDEPVTIDFEIGKDVDADDNQINQDDDSDQDDNNSTQTGNAPRVGSLYDNCIVVKSTSSGSSTTVTLMTIDEYNKLSYSSSQKGKNNEKFQAEIASCIDETLAFFGDDKLRLPSYEELEYVYNNRETINEYIENIDINAPLVELKGGSWYCGYYYLADDGNIYVYTIDGNIEQEPNPNRVTYKVRGFKTLTFTD